jgi:hypothetical protein
MARSRLPTMIDRGALAAIGAAIVGFGIVAFVFRIQRELQVEETLLREWKEETEQRGTSVNEEELLEKAATYRWIPWADRLLVATVTVALLLVLLPIALVEGTSSFWGGRLPAAACSASTVALAGYVPALLVHYQFGPRPARRWIWFGAVNVRSHSVRGSTGGKGHRDRIGQLGCGCRGGVRRRDGLAQLALLVRQPPIAS